METSEKFQIKHNVTIRILDQATGKLISEHTGHNMATNTMIEGVGHYLAGEGVLRQGYSMLSRYVPQYISLGTMGLKDQEENENYLPTGITGANTAETDIDQRYADYMNERPGYGSDGYSVEYNNDRPYMGLGPAWTSFSETRSYYAGDIVYYKGKAYRAKEDLIINPETGNYNVWQLDKFELLTAKSQPYCWELITPTYPRQEISFRDVVPEYEAEEPKTVDVIFSAMIPTGVFDEFRDPERDYVFITEAGLWCTQEFDEKNMGQGLVAGYRIVPPEVKNWYMSREDVPELTAITYLIENGYYSPFDEIPEEDITWAKCVISRQNRLVLQQNILRVKRDQVVQVIWKIQIGNKIIDLGDGSVAPIPEHVQEQIDELYHLVSDKIIYAENVTVPTSRWTSSTAVSGFGYAATINVDEVDSTYWPVVQFKDADIEKYDFAPDSKSASGKITIYCKQKPTTSITLPIIICYKGKAVGAS